MLQFPVLIAEQTGKDQIADMVRPAVTLALDMIKGELQDREVIAAIETASLLPLVEQRLLALLFILRPKPRWHRSQHLSDLQVAQALSVFSRHHGTPPHDMLDSAFRTALQLVGAVMPVG